MSSTSSSTSKGVQGRHVGHGRDEAPDHLGLYVHIPFCETKCPYCDFNTYERIEHLIPAYVEALSREISLWGNVLDHPEVDTVFFGGGTPSYLSEKYMADLMKAIRGGFDLSTLAEVTLEANPGDVEPRRLEAHLEAGFNRLSIGVQSLDDRLLGLLGRRHDARKAAEAFRTAVASGFENTSIDLIYGLPYQSPGNWQDTLDRTIGLGPPHISMYGLTIEEGTPMAQWVNSGRLPTPDPDLAADMYEAAEATASAAGYRHYEISNWALAGYESRHNLRYWRNRPYIGTGPGAHSYLAGFRFSNLRSPRTYIERLEDERQELRERTSIEDAIKDMPAVESVEKVDAGGEMSETMMMGLRLDEGISAAEFTDRFGRSPVSAYGVAIGELGTLGLLDASNGRLRLTARGRLLGNEVFARVHAPGAVGLGVIPIRTLRAWAARDHRRRRSRRPQRRPGGRDDPAPTPHVVGLAQPYPRFPGCLRLP